MSNWNTERILNTLNVLDETALRDDVTEIRTKDYRLLRFPERILSPTFPAAQVVWSNTSKPFDVVFDEIASQVRRWDLDEVHWWVSKATRPVETESQLRGRGGELSDVFQILARELAADTHESQERGDVNVELVHDERTFQAALSIETRGWGRSQPDETLRNRRFAETLDELQNWTGFQIVAFIDNEPASTGCCTLNGDIARLWGAVTLDEFRKRGFYRAVLAERLRVANDHGASLALTRGRPSTSGRILERAGFTSHGEERCYRTAV